MSWNGQNSAFKAFASLRICGKGLDPEHVTTLLALSPTASGVHEGFGSWVRSTKHIVDNLRPLEEHILHILDELKDKTDQLHALRKSFRTEVFCYFASESDLGGFHVAAATLDKMGHLGLDFDVDEYFCCKH